MEASVGEFVGIARIGDVRSEVQMLAKWNAAIAKLRPAIKKPDTSSAFVLYGTAFLPEELPAVPAFDLPAGTPAWMQDASCWAARTGATPALKRRTITRGPGRDHPRSP